MHYVYSTLATNMTYCKYRPNDVKSPGEIEKKVLIRGGSGVATKKNVYTPYGVRTEITNEQLEVLEQDPVFKIHVDNGFIKVEKKKVAVEKVYKDMTPEDISSPLTLANYKERTKTNSTFRIDA